VPLIEYLAGNFDLVQIVAVREKVFPELSEDCWFLYAGGFGGSTSHISLTLLPHFEYMPCPPRISRRVSLREWRAWNCRLRPFIISPAARSLYQSLADAESACRLGDVARVGIGYVTGANDFFHLRPSQQERLGIPEPFLHPSVRNGKALGGEAVTERLVRRWLLDDEPVLLLRLRKDDELPASISRYLGTPAAAEARGTYKCRNRDPWYVVPDVTVPDAFLSYMSGGAPALVANNAKCVCTNSVHVVHLNGRMSLGELERRWADPVTQLSCEVEGHPLGGGMLKVEPREASRLLLAKRRRSKSDDATIRAAVHELRRWRHYG
jgi:hypothetical protein